jgi:NAD-dependent deacetylase
MSEPGDTLDLQLRALDSLLAERAPERVVVITGAGVSAESGIPTFRGKEGYWVVGSKEYHPQEMATLRAFTQMPREVWRWYLYRRGICRAAEPNAAHHALVELEAALRDRFRLITQNVDGLHLRAGNSRERTHEVHGNADFMRVHEDGSDAELLAIPDAIPSITREQPLDDEHWELLRDGRGRRTRPHILWFDEYYDEQLYRAESAIAAASECELIVVAGTSGAAAIPYHALAAALLAGAAMIDINPDDNPFAEKARELGTRGLWLRGSAAQWMPALLERLR